MPVYIFLALTTFVSCQPFSSVLRLSHGHTIMVPYSFRCNSTSNLLQMLTMFHLSIEITTHFRLMVKAILFSLSPIHGWLVLFYSKNLSTNSMISLGHSLNSLRAFLFLRFWTWNNCNLPGNIPLLQPFHSIVNCSHCGNYISVKYFYSLFADFVSLFICYKLCVLLLQC